MRDNDDGRLDRIENMIRTNTQDIRNLESQIENELKQINARLAELRHPYEIYKRLEGIGWFASGVGKLALWVAAFVGAHGAIGAFIDKFINSNIP